MYSSKVTLRYIRFKENSEFFIFTSNFDISAMYILNLKKIPLNIAVFFLIYQLCYHTKYKQGNCTFSKKVQHLSDLAFVNQSTFWNEN